MINGAISTTGASRFYLVTFLREEISDLVTMIIFDSASTRLQNTYDMKIKLLH